MPLTPEQQADWRRQCNRKTMADLLGRGVHLIQSADAYAAEAAVVDRRLSTLIAATKKIEHLLPAHRCSSCGIGVPVGRTRCDMCE